MTICRVQHNSKYVAVNYTITEDTRLSWKAKGIWLYAFSRRDDWKFHVNDLLNRSTDGRDSVYSGLKELEMAGYMKRVTVKGKSGQIEGTEYVFYELPQEEKTESKEKVPQTAFPDTENPDREIPDRANPPLTSINSITSTKETLPNGSVKKTGVLPPNPPPPVTKFGYCVVLQDAKYLELCVEHGADVVDSYISKINDYCEAKGTPKRYKCFAAAIRQWIRKDQESHASSVKKNSHHVNKGESKFSFRKISG